MMIPPFEVTRSVIEQLDGWLAELAAPHLPACRDPDGTSYRWRFTNETPEALQVGKAVRAVSGIRAALLLVDNGYTTEAGSILRTVADFCHEIIAVGEGLLERRLTTHQQRFVDQYFAPMARSPEELETRGKEFYVSREQLFAAHQRIAEKTRGPVDLVRRLTRFLNYGYDKYIHGSYDSSMELFRGDMSEFMLRGHLSERHRCVMRVGVSGKLYETLVALGIMALSRNNQQLFASIRKAMAEIDDSGEQSGGTCIGLA
jgi:hypothetical protein